jgi:hypothetical protein
MTHEFPRNLPWTTYGPTILYPSDEASGISVIKICTNASQSASDTIAFIDASRPKAQELADFILRACAAHNELVNALDEAESVLARGRNALATAIGDA